MVKKLLGIVSHYYPKAGVAVVELQGAMKVGDRISVEGPDTNVVQPVVSIQIDHRPVRVAQAGKSVALRVRSKVKETDHVYLET